MKTMKKLAILASAIFVSMIIITAFSGFVKAGTATIWTDKPDYGPYDTVTIYGSGFNANAGITIEVTAPDPAYSLVLSAASDVGGNFVSTYGQPPPLVEGTYYVVATDGTHTATTTFTDAQPVDFKQYATIGDLTVKHWINSILQASNSIYYEGMSVPQRPIFWDIASTAGNNHFLTLSHEATKGGTHAYDFLTAWNQGNDPILPLIPWGENIGPPNTLGATAQFLHNAPGSGAYEYFVNVPNDPFISKDGSTQARINAYELKYGDRFIRICGNQPITSAVLTLVGHDVANGADTGDSFINYQLSWTSASDQIMVELSGHLSMSGDPAINPIAWGVGLGSSMVNGGPYHFKLDYLDTYSLGSQDNQIKGADILALPGLSLTKTPSVPKVTNGGSVTYTYVVTNTGNIALTVTLTDDKAGTIASNFALAAGASATYNKAVTITTANPSVTNTATATGTSGTGATVTVTATATVNVIHPGISLTKTGTAKVVTGSTVTFTYNVTNTGDVPLTGVGIVDDPLGTIASGQTLAVGESKSFTKATGVLTDDFTNTATATGTHQLGTVTATATARVDVTHPAISITKTGTPADQLAPGTVKWTVVVTNTGDILLIVNVSDTRHGVLDTGLALAPGESGTYTYDESGLGPGTYTNTATATGQHQLGSVSATASATVKVTQVSILKQFTAVTVLPGTSFSASLVDPTHVNVHGLKSGPRIYFNITYYFENSLNFLGSSFDGKAHNFTLWDKWGGNLMALGSAPTAFDVATNKVTLADGSSFNINPKLIGPGTYRGYIGSGKDISSLASQGTAFITIHLGDQQNSTNPGNGKGTGNDGNSYDTDTVWYIGELAVGKSATLTLYIAPGMNPGLQLMFTSKGPTVINTGPRVRAYGATWNNEDFLYAVERTNTLTVDVYP